MSHFNYPGNCIRCGKSYSTDTELSNSRWSVEQSVAFKETSTSRDVMKVLHSCAGPCAVLRVPTMNAN